MSLQDYMPSHQGDASKIFHSNAYARVASGNRMGATAPVSFGSRMDVHRNRQAVRHYGASSIGRGLVQPYAREAPSTPVSSPPRTSGPAVPQRPTTSFHEPPTRYNPYG